MLVNKHFVRSSAPHDLTFDIVRNGSSILAGDLTPSLSFNYLGIGTPTSYVVSTLINNPNTGGTIINCNISYSHPASGYNILISGEYNKDFFKQGTGLAPITDESSLSVILRNITYQLATYTTAMTRGNIIVTLRDNE